MSLSAAVGRNFQWKVSSYRGPKWPYLGNGER